MTNEVTLGAECRALRHRLAPLDWMVMEELALDAVLDEAGRLCSTISARQLAESLGCDPGAVAKALARLRRLGLVGHHRQVGPAGRFGPSLYWINPTAGLRVVTEVRTSVGAPRTAAPRVDAPCVASPRADSPHTERDAAVSPARSRARGSSGSRVGAAATSTRNVPPVVASGDQLGLFEVAGGDHHDERQSVAVWSAAIAADVSTRSTRPVTRDARPTRTRPSTSRIAGPFSPEA